MISAQRINELRRQRVHLRASSIFHPQNYFPWVDKPRPFVQLTVKRTGGQGN
jgi:hypothetical protein